MLNKVTIDNYKSYKEKVETELKEINYFFGYNGVGKTTLSRCIKNYKEINEVQIEGNVDNIYVYNSDFIHNNFMMQDELNGIFYLGQEDIEAVKWIEKAEKIATKLNRSISEIDLEAINKEKKSLLKKIEEILWEKRKASEDSREDFLLSITEGFNNNKSNWAKEVSKKIKLKKEKYNKKELESEYQALYSKSNNEKDLLDGFEGIRKEILDIIGSDLFKEVITGNETNPLNYLISSLDNSSWVSKGKKFIEDSNNKCPFCQQDLSEDFLINLKKYFDEEYEKKLQIIKEFEDDYNGFISLICEKYKSYKDIAILKTSLLENLELIKEKRREPNKKIFLNKIDVTNLEKHIETFNKDACEFNKMIKDREKLKEEFIKKAWIYFFCVLDETSQYKELKEREKEASYKLNKSMNKVALYKKRVTQLKIGIKEKRDKLTNVHTAIDNINRELKLSGLESFEIEKTSDESYKIVRPEESEENTFLTLSEGEKTVLTFLYFCEYCKASSGDTLVIIDDPVSSLDNNHLFNIADLIKSSFIEMSKKKSTPKNCKQLIFSTHSLFFLNEMFRGVKENSLNFYKIKKNNSITQIIKSTRKDISNDYKECWKAIKEYYVEGKSINKSLILIAFRKILEEYFTFVHNYENLKSALDELGKENRNIRVFSRFIDRNNHRDGIGVSYDINEIDFSKFTLKQIFEKADHLAHYNKMMEIEE